MLPAMINIRNKKKVNQIFWIIMVGAIIKLMNLKCDNNLNFVYIFFIY